MERRDAERVFALVAEMSGDLRGRIVSERWWLIWIVSGFQMLFTCALTQWLLWRNETRPFVYNLLWGTHIGLIAPIIFLLHRRAGGQRTATELYLWWIWMTFILCALGVALANALLGLPHFFTAPLLSLFTAFAFSMMAMITYRFLLFGSVYFFAVMLAMCAYDRLKFLIYGGAWFLLLVSLGLLFRFGLPRSKTRRV